MKKNTKLIELSPLKIWDFFVWILLIFPFSTGGLWILRPQLKLEFSQLAIPVLALLILTIGFHYLFHISFQNATSYRLANFIWNKWSKLINHFPNKTLIASAFFFGMIEALVSVRRHFTFESGSYDLGIFANAMWNLSHSGQYISSLKNGANLFSDHQSPLFWLFVPLYRVFPSPVVLLITQAFGLSSAGLILYYLGRQYLPNRHWGLAALPLIYWMYLPIRNANAFDFHPEVLMLPLFLAAALGIQSQFYRMRALGIFTFLLALGAKESAACVAVGIGLSWIAGAGPESTRSFTRKFGLISVITGILVFGFDTLVVPKFFGQTYAYGSNYRHLTTLNILELFSYVLGPARLRFLIGTLAPLAFLPLLNPRGLLASLPGYAILFLSSGDHRVQLIYHYATEPAVGLFLALPCAILVFESILKKSSIPINRAFFWILFWVFLSFGRSELYWIRRYSPKPHHQWLTHSLVPCIHTNTTLSASGGLVPHLSSRLWVNHLPDIEIPGKEQVNCIVRDSKVNNWPLKSELPSSILDRYSSEYKCNDLEILRSRLFKEYCLKCRPECPLVESDS